MREEKGVRSLLFFDPMGRAWAEKQCTPATCGLTPYSLTMSYNFLGNETGYSDGAYSRSTAYDSTDRLNGFSVNNQSLLSNPQYYPYGLKQVTLGNGLTENRNYDPNRLWLTSLQVGTTGNPSSAYSLGLGYYTNGNIYTANDSVNGNWTYQYDNVNRLQKATIGGQNFNYYYTADGSSGQFGNMTCTAPSAYACTPLGLSFNQANNQINSSGYQYDGAGNLLQDNTHGYVYDLENRITCVWGTDGTCTSYNAMQYLYDADGQRVGKQQADTLEDYVYDPQGHITSVYQNGSATPFRAEIYTPQGRHVATENPSTPCSGTLFFNHADWLGTERVRTTSTGSFCQSFTDTPYGMNLAYNPSADTSPMHFTGKQRDYESNLDFFNARYFGGGNNLGRFMTSDPFALSPLHVVNPQRWNMYAYTLNNPTSYTDPTGLDAIAVDFSTMAAGLGHWGIISVRSDGHATYSDYGPKGGGKPFAPGVVKTLDLSTKVTQESGGTGTPSSATFAALQKEVAQIENVSPDTVSFAYFRTSDADTLALTTSLWGASAASQAGNASFYCVGSNDCRGYTIGGLNRAGIHTGYFPDKPSNDIFYLLEAMADADYSSSQGKTNNTVVTTKICNKGGHIGPDGNLVCD